MRSIFGFLIICASFLGMVCQAGLPEIPEGCFVDDSYCTDREVVVNEEGQRVIRIRLFAMVSTDDFETEEEILERYFKFDQWGSYVQGSSDIEFKKSLTLPPIVEDGITKYRQYAHYTTDAPWPINSLLVREVAHHWYLPPTEGADVTIASKVITDRTHHIDGEEDLQGAEGVQYREGRVHLRHDEEEEAFFIYLINDAIPGLDILPRLAAPFIQKSLVAVFRGMFDL